MKKISQIALFLGLVAMGLGCAAQMDEGTPADEDVGSSSSAVMNRDWGDPLGCYWDTDYGLCCAYSGGSDSGPSGKWGCTWCTSNPDCL
jgi:hypothetical protein